MWAEDAGVLRRTAHSFKSNSAEFGAMVLRDLCRELEEMGKAGRMAEPLQGGAGERGVQPGAERARRPAPRIERIAEH